MAEQLKDTVDKVADKLQGASMQQSPDAPIGAFPEEPQTEQVGTTEPDVDMGESKAVEGEAEAEDTPKIFMVCVDGSPNCEAALKSAIKWMKEADALVIVNSPEVFQPRVLLPSWGDRSEVNKKIIERGQETCDHYVDVAKTQVSRVSSRVLVNCQVSPKQALVDYADANNVHTIFVGTRGLGYVRSFFIGSFSRFLVQNAHCNVMVVKPTEPEEGAGPEEEGTAKEAQQALAAEGAAIDERAAGTQGAPAATIPDPVAQATTLP